LLTTTSYTKLAKGTAVKQKSSSLFGEELLL
jgi:hypothetical protein